MNRTVAIAVTDLMFQPRIDAAVRALGMHSTIADSPERLNDALAAGAMLVVLDLHSHAFRPVEAITAARLRGARVLAFGRHTDADALRAARAAGADRVVPRSQLVEELPDLLHLLLPPSAVEPRSPRQGPA